MTMAGMKRRDPERLFERFCEWLENLLLPEGKLMSNRDWNEAIEEAALIVERWSLPTIQTPSIWLVDKAGIAAEIRAMKCTQERTAAHKVPMSDRGTLQ